MGRWWLGMGSGFSARTVQFSRSSNREWPRASLGCRARSTCRGRSSRGRARGAHDPSSRRRAGGARRISGTYDLAVHRGGGDHSFIHRKHLPPYRGIRWCNPPRNCTHRLVLANARRECTEKKERHMAEGIVNPRRILDVSALPNVTFASRSITWWGTLGMMVIEAGVFALALASYFYLHSRTDTWPPGVLPPDLRWGTLNTAIFILSVIPTEWYRRRARAGDTTSVRIGLVIACLIGVATLMVRYEEMTHLNTDWSQTAYGSIVWLIMGLHITHLLTDWGESVVLTVLFFTSHVEGKRFVDAEENASYWYFVVLTWIPIYLVIYWAPRWLRS